MHFTKPALVAASLLWATSFASPISSPTILRTRGLIGGSTTDDDTKNTAGSTAADDAVGNDITKNASESDTVENAVGSLDLDKITGGLTTRNILRRHHGHGDSNSPAGIFAFPVDTVNEVAGDDDTDNATGDLSARDVERLHHGHKSQEGEIVDDALNIADDATPGGFIPRRDIVGDATGDVTPREFLRRHHSHKNRGNGISDGATDTANDATGGDATGDAASGIVGDATEGVLGGIERRDDISHLPPHGDISSLIFLNTPKSGADDSTADTTKRFVVRDNDGAVHDANQAVHEANKAVHDANKVVHTANEVVHNTLHGLLHGILR